MKRFLPLLLLSSFAFAEERTFVLANYHTQGATDLYRSLGHIPENSLIPDGGLMVWAIFDAASPNANRYIEHALSVRMAKESELLKVKQSCEQVYGNTDGQSAIGQIEQRGNAAPAVQSPQCAPELMLLIGKALADPWKRTLKR